MTDEEVLSFYEKLQAYYGDELVDFEHYPNAFAHQVKMYKYYEMPRPVEGTVNQ